MSFLIDFKLAYDLASVTYPPKPPTTRCLPTPPTTVSLPKPTTSRSLPKPPTTCTLSPPIAMFQKQETAPHTVAVIETFHFGSPPVLPPNLPSFLSQQTPLQLTKPHFRFRRHTTPSKPYNRTTQDPKPQKGPCPARSRHQTAPPSYRSLEPALLELLNHITTLYRSVWRYIRDGFSLIEALDHYHLTPDMWTYRRLIAETWIAFREPYIAKIHFLTSLYGSIPRGLVMHALTYAASKTLTHWARKRKLHEKRRDGTLMSM